MLEERRVMSRISLVYIRTWGILVQQTGLWQRQLSGADILWNWYITEMNCVGFGRHRFWHIHIYIRLHQESIFYQTHYFGTDTFKWLSGELTILFTSSYGNQVILPLLQTMFQNILNESVSNSKYLSSSDWNVMDWRG